MLAVLMELNSSGRRYGIEDESIHSRMLSLGFASYCYQPFERKLMNLSGKKSHSGNTLYIKELSLIAGRVDAGPKIS